MSVPTLIRGSFETEGWQYKELSSIRLRGSVTLASVSIYT